MLYFSIGILALVALIVIGSLRPASNKEMDDAIKNLVDEYQKDITCKSLVISPWLNGKGKKAVLVTEFRMSSTSRKRIQDQFRPSPFMHALVDALRDAKWEVTFRKESGFYSITRPNAAITQPAQAA